MPKPKPDPKPLNEYPQAMTPQDIGTFLGLAETATRNWIKALGLLRMAGTSERKPKYRRDDVRMAFNARVPDRADVTEDQWERIQKARADLAAATMHFPKGEPDPDYDPGGDNGGENK